MISLVDTHAHIDLPVFDEDREAMLSRARTAGVHTIVAIGHNPERWSATAALAAAHPFVLRTAGIHPNDAAIWNEDVRQLLEAELATGEPVAVGETGLDYFRDSAPADLQRAAFAAQIELAKQSDLPIVIHQRQAEDEVLAMLREHGPVRGVMHCFTGNQEFAQACLELGLVLGVGGVATYPKSTEIRAALGSVPLEAIILETDAPYLAPQSWRGKRNEPAFMRSAADVLADLHNVSLNDIAAVTSANAIRVFGPRLEQARLGGMDSAAT